MPKWKSSYDSNRKYNAAWEKNFVWLSKSTDGSESAHCKLCRCNIVPRLSNLTLHETTEKHKRNVPSHSQTTLPLVTTPRNKTDDKIKSAEMQIAVSMACHCAIRSVDHLGEIMKTHGRGSTLGDIKLHRTKCIALLKNCISPALKSDLISELHGKIYALIIDESTDISTQKYLCILVRFLSNEDEIVTRFLSLIPVQEATGENIFNHIKQEIENCNQILENCIGFASDGASNMVGCNNSVWSRMKAISPSCVLYKCICHSLALSVQHAVDKLPSNIGFLLKEIPKWFRNSNLRREAFKD